MLVTFAPVSETTHKNLLGGQTPLANNHRTKLSLECQDLTFTVASAIEKRDTRIRVVPCLVDVSV